MFLCIHTKILAFLTFPYATKKRVFEFIWISHWNLLLSAWVCTNWMEADLVIGFKVLEWRQIYLRNWHELIWKNPCWLYHWSRSDGCGCTGGGGEQKGDVKVNLFGLSKVGWIFGLKWIPVGQIFCSVVIF